MESKKMFDISGNRLDNGRPYLWALYVQWKWTILRISFKNTSISTANEFLEIAKYLAYTHWGNAYFINIS